MEEAKTEGPSTGTWFFLHVSDQVTSFHSHVTSGSSLSPSPVIVKGVVPFSAADPGVCISVGVIVALCSQLGPPALKCCVECVKTRASVFFSSTPIAVFLVSYNCVRSLRCMNDARVSHANVASTRLQTHARPVIFMWPTEDTLMYPNIFRTDVVFYFS